MWPVVQGGSLRQLCGKRTEVRDEGLHGDPADGLSSKRGAHTPTPTPPRHTATHRNPPQPTAARAFLQPPQVQQPAHEPALCLAAVVLQGQRRALAWLLLRHLGPQCVSSLSCETATDMEGQRLTPTFTFSLRHAHSASGGARQREAAGRHLRHEVSGARRLVPLGYVMEAPQHTSALRCPLFQPRRRAVLPFLLHASTSRCPPPP